MSELSREARALVRDGRSVLRPSSSDRARIASVLATRLGQAALLTAPQASAAAGKSVAWSKVAASIAGVGLVVGGATAWVSQSSPPDASLPAAPRAVVESRALPPLPTAQVALPPPELTVSAPESTVAPARKQTATDRFAEEVALLSKATTALRAGRPAEALSLLQAHRQRFPASRLVEEQLAARAQALCALGRTSEAAAELARLERVAPQSPHLARVKRVCSPR
jgi:hypothetical protein